jgi:hypothetical protein
MLLGRGGQAGGEGGDLVLLLGQVGRGGAHDQARNPFAAWAATSSAVMSMVPSGCTQRRRVPARGPGGLEHQVDWAARSASVSPPPGK